MTIDEIIHMAKEAGFESNSLGMTYTSGSLPEALYKFAALVAAAEREACAKVCDDWQNNFEIDTRGWWASSAIAVDIRARGQNSAGFYQKKEWVGLTDEEKEHYRRLGLVGVEIIEAKLKEKNT
jgi:hypothetical protein